MKLRRLTLALLTAACCLLTSCEEEDFVPPSFLSIDAIQLKPTPGVGYTAQDGFCSAEIVSCYVEALYKDGREVKTLGLFELPFTVPVLHSGEVEYLVVSPAIKISGISGMQSYYPFYTRDTIRNLTLTSGDTLRLDTLSVHHRVGIENGIKLFEPFEYSPETPTAASLSLDSITWHPNDRQNACSGSGYVSVHVPDSVTMVPFSINRDFYVPDPITIVYLELDSRSDLPFEVYMHSRYTSGGAVEKQRVMVVNPSNHWKHMYINLGRIRDWFNNYPDFRISFAALNVEGKEGDIRLDNVKLLTTTSYAK